MGFGDEVMVTGHARELQARDPRRVRVIYERLRYHEAWLHNPRIAGKDEQGDFQPYVARVNGLRPYMTAKTSERYTWRRYTPPRGELYFDDDELFIGERYRGRLVIEPNIKAGASRNKDWGWANWGELVDLMLARGIMPTQLGPAGTRLVPGVEFVRTRTMRHAAAVLSTARAAVLPEGGLHHVAAAVGLPAVVIFGGFISPHVTGYPDQASLFARADDWPIGCGWRVPCKHCAAAMAAITPGRVMRELEVLLETDRRSLAA